MIYLNTFLIIRLSVSAGMVPESSYEGQASAHGSHVALWYPTRSSDICLPRRSRSFVSIRASKPSRNVVSRTFTSGPLLVCFVGVQPSELTTGTTQSTNGRFIVIPEPNKPKFSISHGTIVSTVSSAIYRYGFKSFSSTQGRSL